MVETLARLVRTRRDRQYSKAVEASRPRVELSQHPTAPRVTIVSAIETRFFSPPETPRINYMHQVMSRMGEDTSFPTRVSKACSIPNILARISRNVFRYWPLDIPSGLCLGVLVFNANANVCFTVKVA